MGELGSFTKQPSPEIVSQATRLFIRVSMKSPTSVTAQAAGVALACRGSLPPKVLSEAFFADPRALKDVMAVATKAHQKRGKEVVMSTRVARRTIEYVFRAAQRMSVLSDSDLEYISGPQYQRFRTNPQGQMSLVDLMILRDKAKKPFILAKSWLVSLNSWVNLKL